MPACSQKVYPTRAIADGARHSRASDQGSNAQSVRVAENETVADKPDVDVVERIAIAIPPVAEPVRDHDGERTIGVHDKDEIGPPVVTQAEVFPSFLFEEKLGLFVEDDLAIRRRNRTLALF